MSIHEITTDPNPIEAAADVLGASCSSLNHVNGLTGLPEQNISQEEAREKDESAKPPTEVTKRAEPEEEEVKEEEEVHKNLGTDNGESRNVEADTDLEDQKSGKELYSEGLPEKAKEAWLREYRSCQYVLNRRDGDDVKMSDEKVAEFEALLKRCRLNLALVSVKLKDFGDAIKFANEVLLTDPQNEKAVYRKALALSEIGKTEEAEKVLATVESRDPSIVSLSNDLRKAARHNRFVAKKMGEALTTSGGEGEDLPSLTSAGSVWFGALKRLTLLLYGLVCTGLVGVLTFVMARRRRSKKD